MTAVTDCARCGTRHYGLTPTACVFCGARHYGLTPTACVFCGAPFRTGDERRRTEPRR